MRADLVDQLAASDAEPELAVSLPSACYRDQDVQEDESSRIFRNGWIGLGRSDIVAEPGSYAAMEIAAVPLILLRDLTGKLRCFANSCRHRGALLLQGQGSTRGIKCPFHGWNYRLDGTLAGAPRMEMSSCFEKSDNGLIEFACGERAGFAFISMDGKRNDLDDHLGDFEAVHQPWPLASLVTTRRRQLEVNCNWKIFLDVFNEYYHLTYVHADTLGGLYHEPDAGDLVDGAFASQFGETHGTGGLLENQQNHALPLMPGLEGRPARGTRYTWLFPNMTFAASTDAVWVYEAYPITPHRCMVRQSICFPPETVALPDFEQHARRYYERFDAAMDEDITALEAQQKGLSSPYTRPGRFQPHLEANVASFACWYARQMRG
ncbi:MAG: aromatic ring-hydroxylating oxygenase subunit alpha [Anderseniella sp.]